MCVCCVCEWVHALRYLAIINHPRFKTLVVVVVRRHCGTFLTGPHYTVSLYLLVSSTSPISLCLPLVDFALSFLKALRLLRVLFELGTLDFNGEKVQHLLLSAGWLVSIWKLTWIIQVNTRTNPPGKYLPLKHSQRWRNSIWKHRKRHFVFPLSQSVITGHKIPNKK